MGGSEGLRNAPLAHFATPDDLSEQYVFWVVVKVSDGYQRTRSGITYFSITTVF